MKKIISMIFLSLAMITSITFSNIHAMPVVHKQVIKTVGIQPIKVSTSTIYQLELSRWGVYNDGTHSVETTKGINDAIIWANQNGYNAFTLPVGTYLIDKNSKINMISNMTFSLSDDTVIQKESNGLESYVTLNVGTNVENVVISGGIYKGDRDTHDYYNGSVTWQPNTVYNIGDKVKRPNITADGWGYYYEAIQSGVSGSKEPAWNWTKQSTDNQVVWKPIERATHEGGEGIVTSGATNVLINNVKTENFTGDGLAVGGGSLYFDDLYQSNFEYGALNTLGQKTTTKTAIRLKQNVSLSDPSFIKTRTLVIDNPKHLNWHFDIYFYKVDGSFLSSKTYVNRGDVINLPDGASSFNLVFHQNSYVGAYLEVWNKIQSKHVTVTNSEFFNNRRQGITVGGADDINISNNNIHDIRGVAPMSGIDVEGGYGVDGYVNSNIKISDNTFSKNARYDVILYDGHDATVVGNSMNSSIGLAVSEPFTNATIQNNYFVNSSIYAYHDVHFIGNTMSGSFTHMEGPNLTIDGMVFKNGAEFVTSSAKPFGITIKNVTLYDSNFSSWVEPINVSKLSMYGGHIGGNIKPGSIFNDMKMYRNMGTDIPSGIYNNFYYEADSTNRSDGPHSIIPGTFVFNNSTFKGMGLYISNPNSYLTVKNSTFNVDGDTNAAITIPYAKTVDLENNMITSTMLHNDLFRPSVIMLGNYWTKNDPANIQSATIKNNTIKTIDQVNGISTIFAGKNARLYDVENNTLYNAKLDLKSTDINKYNRFIIGDANSGYTQENPIHLNFSNKSLGSATNSVAFNGSRYIAVGTDGSLLTSIDSKKWTRLSSPKSTVTFNSIIFAKGQFVAVGTKGTIMTSSDGLKWYIRDSHSTYAQFQSVKFLNNQFIAVGWSGTIETSPNGVVWTKQNLPNNSVEPLTDIAWNGKLFIAPTDFGKVYVSKDGVTWIKNMTIGEIVSITSDGKKFVGVGNQGVIITSNDGVNWTKQVSSTINKLYNVTYTGEHFIAAGDNGTILTSSSGIYWSTEFTNTTKSIYHVDFVNNQLIFSHGANDVLIGTIVK